MTNDEAVRAILKDARDWLSDKEHWCQGRYVDDLGRTCLIGAVSVAHTKLRGEICYAAQVVLHAAARDLYGNLCRAENANDDIGYDAAMRVLDLAISRS